MSGTFQKMSTYRDLDKDKPVDVVFFDEETIVEGLQGFKVMPLYSETDGVKVKVYFAKDEAMPVYQKMQQALAGIVPDDDPVMEFFVRMVIARAGWRSSLAMMRNFKSNSSKTIH